MNSSGSETVDMRSMNVVFPFGNDKRRHAPSVAPFPIDIYPFVKHSVALSFVLVEVVDLCEFLSFEISVRLYPLFASIVYGIVEQLDRPIPALNARIEQAEVYIDEEVGLLTAQGRLVCESSNPSKFNNSMVHGQHVFYDNTEIDPMDALVALASRLCIPDSVYLTSLTASITHVKPGVCIYRPPKRTLLFREFCGNFDLRAMTVLDTLTSFVLLKVHPAEIEGMKVLSVLESVDSFLRRLLTGEEFAWDLTGPYRIINSVRLYQNNQFIVLLTPVGSEPDPANLRRCEFGLHDYCMERV
jgi:hypothetical protein